MKLGMHILAWLLGLTASPLLAGQPVLKVHPQIQASGRTVCLEELGTLYARKSERSAFKQVCLKKQDLISKLNSKGTLSLQSIAEQIANKVPDLSVVGPDKVIVQTQPTQTADQLIKVAHAWLQSELEKRFESVETVPSTRQPTGHWNANLRWQIRQESILPKRHQCVWLDGYDNKGIQQSWPACFQVRAMGKVLVYNKDLAVGDVIEPDLVSSEMIDVTTLMDKPAELHAKSAYIASSLVKAGTPILESHARVRPDVLKNGSIVIVSKVGQVEILAQGYAIEEGQIGDEVRVKSKGGEEPFRAIVTGKDKVTIGGDA